VTLIFSIVPKETTLKCYDDRRILVVFIFHSKLSYTHETILSLLPHIARQNLKYKPNFLVLFLSLSDPISLSYLNEGRTIRGFGIEKEEGLKVEVKPPLL